MYMENWGVFAWQTQHLFHNVPEFIMFKYETFAKWQIWRKNILAHIRE